ncbi:hypothetical protein QQF64_012806 [Cirrhinus molitorella]|uniref:Uncharacterized protein n=1 Tax=Cirrhinus molitorella TaxID=172907 RepID=A0ABR3LZ20_9TELE
MSSFQERNAPLFLSVSPSDWGFNLMQRETTQLAGLVKFINILFILYSALPKSALLWNPTFCQWNNRMRNEERSGGSFGKGGGGVSVRKCAAECERAGGTKTCSMQQDYKRRKHSPNSMQTPTAGGFTRNSCEWIKTCTFSMLAFQPKCSGLPQTCA